MAMKEKNIHTKKLVNVYYWNSIFQIQVKTIQICLITGQKSNTLVFTSVQQTKDRVILLRFNILFDLKCPPLRPSMYIYHTYN
jgi:hypothetical protein